MWSRRGTTSTPLVWATDAGYDPWDAEPLWSAFNVEKVPAVMVTIAYVVGAGTDQALKLTSR